MTDGNEKRILTRAMTKDMESTSSEGELEEAMKEVEKISSPSVSGSISSSIATSAAKSFIEENTKLDPFGGHGIWVPATRPRSGPSKLVRKFLKDVYAEAAALASGGPVILVRRSSTISKIFLESPFILKESWQLIKEDSFTRAALEILTTHISWTHSQTQVLQSLPPKAKLRKCLEILLKRGFPREDDRKRYLAALKEDVPEELRSLQVEASMITAQTLTQHEARMQKNLDQHKTVARSEVQESADLNLAIARSLNDGKSVCTVTDVTPVTGLVKTNRVELSDPTESVDRVELADQKARNDQLQSQLDQTEKKMRTMEELARKEIDDLKKATEESKRSFEFERDRDVKQLNEALEASRRMAAIESKRPVVIEPVQIVADHVAEDSFESQCKIESAIRGAGPSGVHHDEGYFNEAEAPKQEDSFLSNQAKDPHLVQYAPKPKDDEYMRRYEDSFDDEGKPMSVWCTVKRDKHGKLTSEPDLGTIERESMISFDVTQPPPWANLEAKGRARVSRRAIVSDAGADLKQPNVETVGDVETVKNGDTDWECAETLNAKQRRRFARKTGEKYRKKREADRQKKLRQYEESDFSDIFMNSDPRSFGNADDPSEGSDSDKSENAAVRLSLARDLAARRLMRRKARHRQIPSFNTNNDDYTNALHEDLTGESLHRPARISLVRAKDFSAWWKDNGTKWKGPTFDIKYPFHSWKCDWARLLDVNSPYFESVPTLSQQRSWFWDTVGAQVKQHRDAIVEAGKKSNLLKSVGGRPIYGAMELIAAVHTFCYPDEETAARLSEWNKIEFKSEGNQLLEKWAGFYFYLKNFQMTLPKEMHSPSTLYLKLLTIVDAQPWWQHPLQMIEMIGRDPDKIYNVSRSCISAWIRSSGPDRVPNVALPRRPPATPTVSFATSADAEIPEPPRSPPPKSFRGTTHRRMHRNADRNQNCHGCGESGHWFPACTNKDKHDYRRRFVWNLQKKLDRGPRRPDRKAWREVSAYLTQSLSADSSQTDSSNENEPELADEEYNSSVQSASDQDAESPDVHSNFTISEDLSSYYGDFSRDQGLKQDRYAMGLAADSDDSSTEPFGGRRH